MASASISGGGRFNSWEPLRAGHPKRPTAPVLTIAVALDPGRLRSAGSGATSKRHPGEQSRHYRLLDVAGAAARIGDNRDDLPGGQVGRLSNRRL